jgi:hypothetical protein
MQIPPITISAEVVSRLIDLLAIGIVGYAVRRKGKDILDAINERAVNAAEEAVKPVETKMDALKVWCEQHETRDADRHRELLAALATRGGSGHGD